jgi:hypothetical protein
MPVGAYSGAQTSVGNGVTTVFPYAWKILDQTHIEVKVNGVLKVLGADYTVSGVGASNGGNVTFLVAPANLAVVQRARKVPYVRTTDYQANGDFKADTVGADFDSEEMQVQQLAADIARAFKAPLSVTADQVLTDAVWAARASKVYGFDAAGNPTLVGAVDNTLLAAQLADTALVANGDAMIGVQYEAPGSAALNLHSYIEDGEYQFMGFVPQNQKAAIRDGSTAYDATAALTTGLTAAGGRILRLPSGIVLANPAITSAVVPNGKAFTLRGQGMTKTILKAANALNPIIGLDMQDGGWYHSFIEDLTIQSANGYTQVGVQFGSVAAGSPWLTGRVRFNKVHFVGQFDKAVEKKYGNIGNAFTDCVFNGANYNYFAKDNALMHAGNDTFDRCYMISAQKANIYVNGLNGAGILGFTVRDTIIEACLGPAVHIINQTGKFLGVTLDRLHFEANASAASVTVDGVVHTPPYELYFENCPTVSVKSTPIDKMRLVNSTVLLDDPTFPGIAPSMSVDAASAIVADNMRSDNITVANTKQVLARSILGSPRTGTAVWFKAKPRSIISKSAPTGGVVRVSKSFARSETENWNGTTSINAPCVQDGTLFDCANELVIGVAGTWILNGTSFNFLINKYYVMTFDAKKMSGVTGDPGFGVTGGANLFQQVKIDDADWMSYVGLRSTVGIAGAAVDTYMQTTTSAAAVTTRFSALQVVEFTNLADAIAFIESGIFCATELPRRAGTISADNGDAIKTLTVGVHAPSQRWATPLTVNRAITLDATGARKGDSWHIVRTAASTGAFNLDVGGLKNLAVGQWADVEYDGAAWFLSRFGAL